MFKEYVAAGYPILAVKTYEPDRALSVLAQQAKEHYACASWDVEHGIREIAFTDTDIVLKSGQAAQNPLDAIKQYRKTR